jgi:hypothetical protein
MVTGGTCDSYSLQLNILEKQLCSILLSPPSVAGAVANPSLQIDIAVLMSISHRLLIHCCPNTIKTINQGRNKSMKALEDRRNTPG